MLLELFRNHKRWLMFIAMVLVIPSFVVTGIYSYNRMISDDGAIAKVDDVSILPQQFDEAKRQRLENLRVRLGEEFRSNMLDSQEAKVALLEAIMNERSLIGETSLEDIHVSEQVAIEMIKTFPRFLTDGKFDAEKYTNYLAASGMSDEYFAVLQAEGQPSRMDRRGLVCTGAVSAMHQGQLLPFPRRSANLDLRRVLRGTYSGHRPFHRLL